jgi:hypothetical protein
MLGLLAGLLAAPAAAGPALQEIQDAPRIREAIEASVDPDTRRNVPRLPRVTIDTTGDVTVVLALRDQADDPQATYAAALDDTLVVLSAVYHSPDAERVTTTTLVGTFAVIGASGRQRELPVLRAALSAQRAAELDWSSIAPEQLPSVVDVWWVHPAFYGREALLGG